jgi:hypothetical protein
MNQALGPATSAAKDYLRHGTPDEERLGQEIYESLMPRISKLAAIMSDGYMHAEPRSSLSLDNKYLGAYRGGGLYKGPLSSALDGLRTIEIILGQNVLPMTSLYPLLRGVYENSATAVWLVSPDSRDIRLQRSYRLINQEIADQQKFSRAIGAESTERVRLQRKELEDLLATRPSIGTMREIRKAPTATEIVMALDALMSRASDKKPPLFVLWQLFSGVAHGRQWAAIATLNRTEAIVDPVSDTAWVKMESSSQMTALALIGAIESLEFALQQFGKRARAWASLPEDALE